MAEAEKPPHVDPSTSLVFFLVTAVVGTLLFVAFSFLTFGLPLLVVAVGAVLWCYVGLMRLIDHVLGRVGDKGRKDPREH